MNRHFILPLIPIAVAAAPAMAQAQSTFPAPLPGQLATPPSATLPVPVPEVPPSVPSLAKPSDDPSEACRKEYLVLRSEAERRGQLLKAASEKHQRPDVACKLITSYQVAEVKMIRYVEANSAVCQIPPDILDQLKSGHEKTSRIAERICVSAVRTRNQLPDSFGATDFGDPVLFPRR